MSETHTELLGDLATARRGITYSESALRNNSEDGLPYINMKSFLKDGGYNREGLKYYAGFHTTADLTKEYDLLIANTDVTRDGDIIGVPALLPDELKKSGVLFSHHVTRLSVSSKLDTGYLYYLLCSDEYRRAMKKYARGTTVLMLDMQGIKRIPIRYSVSLEAQKNTTRVLASIDTAIEKTEALIEKYQHIKAGLMHDLFTRGVLPNGQLRPPREQAPELYQETAIGWIPKGWKVSPLGNLCELSSGGTPSRAKDNYWGGSIPWVKTGEIRYNEIFETDEYITTEGLRSSSAKIFPRGTIVMAIYGEGNTRGRVATLGIDSASNQACVGFSFEPNVHDRYMYYFFERNYDALRDISNDGSQKNLSASLLKKFPVSLPADVQEQIVMAKRLSMLDRYIKQEAGYLKKLQIQKLGLMQDLLTGKVQVNVAPDSDETPRKAA